MKTIKTKNFNPKSDPKLLCTCGHEHCDKRSVDQITLDKVQLMRNDYGKSMVINSGARCPLHRNEVGRGKFTDHQLRYTVDIACDNLQDETKIKVLAGRHGATRVAGAFKDGFVHCSWTPTARKDVPTWEYS